jgi:hypothetical protein
MKKSFPGKAALSLLVGSLILSGFVVALSPTVTQAEKASEGFEQFPHYEEKRVVINLASGEVFLHKADGTVEKLTIVTQGKPGSYYETIGGYYENDYKEKTHFSSFGHVYMPWSVHVFGNYFIHGIPYYEDGARVSSSYSGGCVRLLDEDAKRVYEFIDPGTPIVIMRTSENEFAVTSPDSEHILSIETTALMAAIISLETLKQDDLITLPDGTTQTRLSSLESLIHYGDTSVADAYATSIGKDNFVHLMNEKARAIGLSSTVFTSTSKPTQTTKEDRERLLTYIRTYKSYLATPQI